MRTVERVPVPGWVEPPGAPVLVGDLIAWSEEGVGAEEQLDAHRFTARRVECVALAFEFGVMSFALSQEFQQDAGRGGIPVTRGGPK
ncbi:hypothetical protein [Streptomyces sp. NPDC001307]|uniref:hypothetical protein n=1 Tax=Streptomyces sp. NPDC001307 TaxID=3364560 RepID=UPI00368E0188